MGSCASKNAAETAEHAEIASPPCPEAGQHRHPTHGCQAAYVQSATLGVTSAQQTADVPLYATPPGWKLRLRRLSAAFKQVRAALTVRGAGAAAAAAPDSGCGMEGVLSLPMNGTSALMGDAMSMIPSLDSTARVLKVQTCASQSNVLLGP